MVRAPNRVRSSHEICPEASVKLRDRERIWEKRRAKTLLLEDELSPRRLKLRRPDNSRVTGKIESVSEKKALLNNETFRIIRAMLLALSVLALCYYVASIEYRVYSVLENGQIVQGFRSRHTVTSFSLGYSVPHSVMFVVAVGMLLYSIILKQPHFSLPLMGLFLTELVCDSCNAAVTIWYLFEYLQLRTALFYTTGFLLLISVQIWMWLGVLQLYEQRKFESQ